MWKISVCSKKVKVKVKIIHKTETSQIQNTESEGMCPQGPWFTHFPFIVCVESHAILRSLWKLMKHYKNYTLSSQRWKREISHAVTESVFNVFRNTFLVSIFCKKFSKQGAMLVWFEIPEQRLTNGVCLNLLVSVSFPDSVTCFGQACKAGNNLHFSCRLLVWR